MLLSRPWSCLSPSTSSSLSTLWTFFLLDFAWDYVYSSSGLLPRTPLVASLTVLINPNLEFSRWAWLLWFALSQSQHIQTCKDTRAHTSIPLLSLDSFMILRHTRSDRALICQQECIWICCAEFKRRSEVSKSSFPISALMKRSCRCLAVWSGQTYLTRFQVDLVNVISVMDPHHHRLVKQRKIHTSATAIYLI